MNNSQFVEEIIKQVLHNKDNFIKIAQYDINMIKTFLESCIKVHVENILTSDEKDVHIEQFMVYYYTYKMLIMEWIINDLMVDLVLINKDNMALLMDIKNEYDGNLYKYVSEFLDRKGFE